MRYSLVKNCCPSCGQALLGEVYVQRLSFLSDKIKAQSFANGLSSDTVFDMSMFVLSEFFLPKESSDDIGSQGDQPDGDNTDENSELDKGSAETLPESLEDIREQVRDEALESSPNDDEDLKIARLKRLANESKSMRKPGALVRRLES
jgi:hypothetical protein